MRREVIDTRRESTKANTIKAIHYYLYSKYLFFVSTGKIKYHSPSNKFLFVRDEEYYGDP